MKSLPSSISTNQQFVHEPLDLHKVEIRVIRVLPSQDGFIECEIKHCSILDEHVCLSYMWGEDEPSHSIMINGSCFKIRRNLYAFLKIARKHGLRDWLWIDAICIDQENLKERNHQVQRMADIYLSAQHVYVYPGKVSNFSYQFAKTCTQLRLHHVLNAWDPWIIRPFMIPLRYVTWPLLYQPHQLPYWNRLWIVQELALANERYVVMPERIIPWQKFESAYLNYGQAYEVPRVWKMCHGWHRWGKRPLDYLITSFANAECQDPRDHVFGLLGLTRSKVQVDYLGYTSHLFLSVIENLLLDPIYSLDSFRSFTTILARSLQVSAFTYCVDCATSPQMKRGVENVQQVDDEWDFLRGSFAWKGARGNSLHGESTKIVNKFAFFLGSYDLTDGLYDKIGLDSCQVCQTVWQLPGEAWTLKKVESVKGLAIIDDTVMLTWVR